MIYLKEDTDLGELSACRWELKLWEWLKWSRERTETERKRGTRTELLRTKLVGGPKGGCSQEEVREEETRCGDAEPQEEKIRHGGVVIQVGDLEVSTEPEATRICILSSSVP